MNQPLRLQAEFLAGASAPRRYLARFVRAGATRTAGNRPADLILEAQALRQAAAAGLFDQRAVFVDHAAHSEHPSLRNLAGVTLKARYDENSQAVVGAIQFYRAAHAITALLDEILEQKESAPDIGLSIVFWASFDPTAAPGGARRVTAIQHVESVDLVFEPAADGRILHALSTFNLRGTPRGNHSTEGGDPTMSETISTCAPSVPAAGSGGSAEAENLAQLWLPVLAKNAAGALIAASGLPPASREKLLAQTYLTPSEVQQAIEAERRYLAQLAEAGVVTLGANAPRAGGIQLGLDGIERVRLALEALLMGRQPASGIPPLSGIREAYHLLSGDYEMTGVFHPERIYLANVNSSTMAEMTANALNKVVANEFQQYPRWWEKIALAQDFTSLQQAQFITLGGIGELPTVAEGAAYTELSWDDSAETAAFVKKGGYLGVTIEAIDKDDTRRLQAAPRALAQAAWLTLSKAVSDLFTVNGGTGPTLSDALTLFHASHANLGSSALTISAWAQTRAAMRKQTELHSGERLGALTAPRYLLVPPDLEVTALQVLSSEMDYSYALTNGVAAPANIFAEGSGREALLANARERVIVVDLWTDGNNWAAVADPRLYPCIGIGFRYGRTPEIFSVASPTAGLMFSNDTMPIKVRFFFAVGPTDYRGLYKHNVA